MAHAALNHRMLPQTDWALKDWPHAVFHAPHGLLSIFLCAIRHYRPSVLCLHRPVLDTAGSITQVVVFEKRFLVSE